MSKGQKIKLNYDQIMKSIKIQHDDNRQLNKTQMNKSQIYLHASYIHRTNLKQQHVKQIEPTYLPYQNIQYTAKKDKNQVYSSIVYDDLNKQSCFQSVCRKTNNSNQLQFKFYDSFTLQTNTQQNKIYHNDRQQKSASKFKKFKNKTMMQATHSIQFLQNNKQNDGLQHNNSNIKPNKSVKCFKQMHTEHRYLSHTQTSQKKLRPKKILTVSQRPQHIKKNERNLKKSIGKQRKKAGIQVINQRCYNS